MAFEIDSKVEAGHILNIAVSLCAIMLSFWRIASRLSKMEMKLNLIWKWYKKQHDIDGDNDEN